MHLIGGPSGKEPACQCRTHKRCGFDPWVGKIPWRRAWQPIPVFLPGESHGQGSLADYLHGVTKSQIRLERLGTHTRQSQASPLTPVLCSFHHCVRDLSFLKPLGDLSLLKGLIMVILLITSLSSPWTEPEHPGFWPLPSCSISLTKAVLTDTAISTHVFCSLLLNRS